MTRDTLITGIQSDLSPRWLFFWGHQPSKDGSLSNSCFSQWWEGHPFVIDGVRYATAEHFMMAEKARRFGDVEARARIIATTNPAAVKKLGRTVSGFWKPVWLEARWDIVVRGNLAKFGQHPELKAFLLQTGDRVLVEASPHDRIWGIGMAASDADAENPAKWKGLNLLGFALMEVRERLKREEP